MTESYLWQQLRGSRPFSEADIDLNRVENSVGNGAPDVEGCWLGKQVWIELKIFKGNRVHFRYSQRTWIKRREKAGGHCYVLARKNNELRLYDAPALVSSPVVDNAGERWFAVEPDSIDALLWMSEKPFDWLGLRVALFGK